MESPNATIAVAGEAVRTSIDFNQNIAVVLPVNGLPSSDDVWSPASLAVRYEMTTALPC